MPVRPKLWRIALLLVLGIDADLAAPGGTRLRSWDEAEALARATVAKMTPAERHQLMRGVGWAPFIVMGFPKPYVHMGNTLGVPRLGVPSLKLHDAGNGFRNNPQGPLKPAAFGTSTCWPSALALAASWDLDMTRRVATAIAREFKGKGSNILLGPAVQVHRVARNGRNFEYLSGDDPYLGSRLGEVYIHAVQEEGVMAVAKHWAFNEQETERSSGSSDVDERTAWELYYPPFEAAVNAGVGSFMCSYNKVNGTYACENAALLKRDLKQKLGFRGFVMSDWWAAHSLSVVDGLDQEMPGVGSGWMWSRDGPHLNHEALEAAETGVEPPKGPITRLLRRLLGTQEVTAADPSTPRPAAYLEPALRILAAVYRLRLEEEPGCTPEVDCEQVLMSNQTSPEHSQLAHEAAVGGIVLLKNQGVLPLDLAKVNTIALIGSALDAQALHKPGFGFMPPGDYYSGGGSGHVGAGPGLITPLAGITARAAVAGVSVTVSASNNISAGLEAAATADVAIVVAATTSIEGEDRPHLDLDDNANELISALASKGPTVVLVQAPGVVLMPWREDVAGIAVLFLGGERTGSAWGSVLFGDATPSGKLPIMLPKNRGYTIEPTSVVARYTEGLFTSYRAKDAAVGTAFAFGHGLSYTTFQYGQPHVLPASQCAAALCVRSSVKNVGSRPGAEVAQAYLEFPPEAGEPKLLLRGFHRTGTLAPGAQETFTFALTERDLSIYQGGWRLQPRATLHVGASSADLRGSAPLVTSAAASAAAAGDAGNAGDAGAAGAAGQRRQDEVGRPTEEL